MSEDWDWKLTDRSKRQFEALDEYARDRIISKLEGSCHRSVASRQITSNRSRERHIRSFGLDSSASDAVPIVNNEYWLC